MSVYISAAVWRNSKASGTALLVLISLADQANDDGTCWPSVHNIAKRCRVDDRTVQRRLDELEHLGEITRERRDHRSTIYTVRVTEGDADATSDNLPPVAETPPPGGAGATQGVALVPPRNVSEPSVSKSRARQTSLPENWQPKAKEQERALAMDLDIDVEVERFRNHAEQNDRRCVSWDAAFRNWLIGSKNFTTPRGKSANDTATWGWE
jgi:hypothetical protein